MSTGVIFFLTALLAALAALLVSAARSLRGPVSRRRVEEFAKLHWLPVTAGNGNQIIAYRATTRRWRAAGLLLSLGVQAVAGDGLSIQFWWVLAGWFAGAIVAELRVAHLGRAPRAAASLARRQIADYLPAAGRWAVPAAVTACLLVALIEAVRAHTDPDQSIDVGALALWTVLGVTVGMLTLASQRYVLRRPQPHAEPDRLAADDAIRSRSMHVLAGAGMTLVLYCVLGQLTAAGSLTRPTTALLLLGNPLAGRVLAYWPWSPARPHLGPHQAAA
ncbi:MAG: hypothetical protein JF587_24165 [Catenulisporales bacterium]|nr:hypothetical protein [Catenulisporales bacterium]